MHRIALPTLCLCLATVGLVAARTFAAKTDPVFTSEQTAFYSKEVLPILKANCLSCHGGEKKIKGALNLAKRADAMKGGDSGSVLDKDKPTDSLLLKVLSHSGDIQMPPKGKLPQGQIDIIAKWVAMGMPYASDAAAEKPHGPPQVDAKAKAFWSFKPVQAVSVPQVKNAGWVRNPVDAFVLSRLEAKQYAPAPPTDKATLLKRATYAVTGLPPTLREVEDFLNDASPDAYEKVVDRLLASRHLGEHWARHWLDLARFAETNSFERDGPKAYAYKYRDYVIRAFNQDKPYDLFIREQLAGDELDKPTRDSMIATGFLRLGLWDDEPADRELSYYEQLDDILSTAGQAFLGLTVGCARCHDHKIDPFPQKDYYKLLAFFHGVNGYGNGDQAIRTIDAQARIVPNVKPDAAKKDKPRRGGANAERVAYERKLAELAGEIASIEDKIAASLVAGEKDDFRYEANRPAIAAKRLTKEENERYADLLRKRSEWLAAPPDGGEPVMAVIERGPNPRETHILVRGLPAVKGDAVEPGFPSVITDVAPALPKPAGDAKSSGRRKVLADWVADPKNPMTARVMANRLFQYTFGRGIVRSSSNFGYQGNPPTHPELLDWLANEFVRNGWHVKPILRTLLTSNAFRMSSAMNEAAFTKDPENDLLWRFDPRRLAAEEIRDTLLAACGTLNLAKTEGPSVYPTIQREVLEGQSVPGNGWGKSSEREAASRSVFVYAKRSLALPLLFAFDTPDPDSPCPVRFTTTQPAQALSMINGAFLNEQAAKLAERARKDAGDAKAAVANALRIVLLREPSAKEIERGVKLIDAFRKEDKLEEAEAFRLFCLMALNLNEVVYLD